MCTELLRHFAFSDDLGLDIESVLAADLRHEHVVHVLIKTEPIPNKAVLGLESLLERLFIHRRTQQVQQSLVGRTQLLIE